MRISFIDLEVGVFDKKPHDFGAINENGDKLHTGSARDFQSFIEGSEYLCGHNIIAHDAQYFDVPQGVRLIDTLYLSTLLFPQKPYHRLLKDDKLQTEELNNPLNDAVKAKELFFDEVNAFSELDDALKCIFYLLLKNSPYFTGFFDYIHFEADGDVEKMILDRFKGEMCENAQLSELCQGTSVELAYCLALIAACSKDSLLPRWVQISFPNVDHVMRFLRNTACHNCEYCKNRLDPIAYLEKYFGYSSFRKYNGEPLQEKAVGAAVDNKSLLAIFPTGGGKSLTFQIPALMAGENAHALTVVISPLQSLMKDQVDNLEKKGITDAVTINGLLNTIERAEAIERVESGMASILYISPESLRSATIERLFMSRHIDRFVIDEAHCFSAWGQDFRVDYLYIGDFIRELQEKKGKNCKIPVSCFTATAKQKVISDIKEYFKEKLDIELELYATNASRTNLRYEVLFRETDAEKYETLRTLLEQKNCPTIVYVSRTKRTMEIAEKLNGDGFNARAFHGKMESREKQENQEAFINDEARIMVATSAFGMGVDKSNVKLVVHYDISDSLENYVQEAGRAGRDETLDAECYVLFNDDDLDKHFILLNQTKLSISEIQQVWKAIKDLTHGRSDVCCSPLEVARAAGWDDDVLDIETRVKTAIQALENAGYVKRGKNIPHVYADSILAKNMVDASKRIDELPRFGSEEERTVSKRIIQSLISSRSRADAGSHEGESRVDYIADRLGIEKAVVIHSIELMREEGLLADMKDLTAYIQKTDTENRSLLILRRFSVLEEFLLEYIMAAAGPFETSGMDKICANYKELNERALESGVKTSAVKSIKILFYYWTIRGYIQKEQDMSKDRVTIAFRADMERIRAKRRKSYSVAEFIINYLFDISKGENIEKDEAQVQFSVIELLSAYRRQSVIDVNSDDVEEALLFLSKIDALRIEGGFFVLYNGMRITRLELDNKIRYKVEDYRQLDEYYRQRIRQIHIVGEYAKLMVRDYDTALQFVRDYFLMDHKKFLSKYFDEKRLAEIERNITPEKYNQLFGTLSDRQLEIIKDDNSKHIVVAAGPGSGKTRVLVHKLASLLLLEDVKHEQLLMLTFSRAAAIEFKQRLRELIGNAANFVEIKTFHSYCFDLLGKIGSVQESDSIVKDAGELIQSGEVDLGKITKAVLVIDEAQDMDENEYALVKALMERNEDMRVIAVGDDDQNIYRFRGADAKYLRSLVGDYGAKQYSLIDNYRSSKNVVAFANQFVKSVSDRMKSEDIRAVTDNPGEVRMIKHRNTNMEISLVEDIMSMKSNGSICVLTNTNTDALLLLGVMRQHNIPAKLIQSMDGFRIHDIAEIRYFLKMLDKEKISPVISDDQWKNAKEALRRQYSDSECLPIIMKILHTFEAEYEKKYHTDLDMFLYESKIEDFDSDERGVITISTIHKSKGREFDNVYMLLKDVRMSNDDEKRKLYVGMTRAKKLLDIHYVDDVLDTYARHATEHLIDAKTYPEPKELIMQLSHKDVFLDFFKDKKAQILQLRSGKHLAVRNGGLCIDQNGSYRQLLRFSTRCNENIKKLAESGYTPYDSVIRYICAWKGKEDTEETSVILADVFFKKESE